MKASPQTLGVMTGFAHMEDDTLAETADGVLSLAPTSPLAANTMIAAGVADLSAKTTAFKAAAKAATKSAATAEHDRSEAAKAQTELVWALSALALLVQNNARSEGDITSMALTPRPKKSSTMTKPEPPPSIDVIMPTTGKGRVTVAAHETGKTRGRYVAEWTAEPMGSWTALPGTGKRRTVMGASGTKVWVRFARVRRQAQSEWCEPVLVTIP